MFRWWFLIFFFGTLQIIQWTDGYTRRVSEGSARDKFGCLGAPGSSHLWVVWLQPWWLDRSAWSDLWVLSFENLSCRWRVTILLQGESSRFSSIHVCCRGVFIFASWRLTGWFSSELERSNIERNWFSAGDNRCMTTTIQASFPRMNWLEFLGYVPLHPYIACENQS